MKRLSNALLDHNSLTGRWFQTHTSRNRYNYLRLVRLDTSLQGAFFRSIELALATISETFIPAGPFSLGVARFRGRKTAI